MLLDEFIIWVYCWVDDQLRAITQHCKLRQRGFSPALSDAEVITMEIVGEFQGKDADKHIWSYFTEHWMHFFPKLGSRSQFGKQALNLWAVKQRLHEKLMGELGSRHDPVHLVDGFPLPICHFKRAQWCHRFKGTASYGYCASKDQTYLGFEGHILLDLRGAIAGFTLTAAHESEREAVWELTESIRGGLLLGDKGYLGAGFQKELLDFRQLELETPVRSNMKDKQSKLWRTQLNRLRRRVETTIGQLVERFRIERTWARTLLSLTNRLTRKLLSHSLAVLANCSRGVEPLQLEKTVQS
jgi:hypothetical protein